MKFDDYYGHALDMVNHGMNPDKIAPPLFPAEHISNIKEKLRIYTAVSPGRSHVLGDNENDFWYKPEYFNGIYWPNYLKKLKNKNWPNQALKDIDESTTTILRHLNHPENSNFQNAGLVVGYVQSGKTANYAGLISKSIDCGYKVFIILSGIHNNLRDQTQKRLESDLKIRNKAKQNIENQITYMTSEGHDDFDNSQHPSIFLGSNPKIFIIKKNTLVLEGLLNWLDKFNEEELSKYPAIIIDDEADNATIDISANDIENNDFEDIEDNNDPSKTNKYIREIRNKFSKVCYIGYTATPFANVLIDPFDINSKYGETLYPKDFIISLPKPEGYYGTSELFPDISSFNDVDIIEPNKHIHLVKESDHYDLISTDNDNYKHLIPNSLKKAFFHFVLSGIIKLDRQINNLNHTFLIHVHHVINVQALVNRKFLDFFSIFKKNFQNNSMNHPDVNQDLERFEQYWEKIKFDFHAQDISFKSLKDKIGLYLEKIEIIMVNSESEKALEFNDEKNKNDKQFIIIGGNRLSRGLTIEGLTVTYFTRNSKFYDTFLQMGRWFGFRKGYDDLIQIFTTSDNYYWFSWLNHVEEGIRLDIERYQYLKKTPMELAVRIKTHPGMQVTSPQKITNVEQIQSTFDGKTMETRKFKYDEKSVNNNMRQLNRLIPSLSIIINEKPISISSNYLWKNVPSKICISFINSLEMYEDDPFFLKKSLLDYIKKHVLEYNELGNWSVLLANNTKTNTLHDFGDKIVIGLSNRSKMKSKSSISMLLDYKHFSQDLPGDENYKKDNGKPDLNKIFRKRTSDNPIMVIYVIDKNSNTWEKKPEAYEKFFINEDYSNHLVGLGIMLPFSKNAERNDFVVLKGIDHDVDR
jgi:hypothetical protein